MNGCSRASIGLAIAGSLILTACAPAGPVAGPAPGGRSEAQAGAKKRIVGGFIHTDIVAVSALPPDSEGRHMAQIVHAGLTQSQLGFRHSW